MGDTNEKQFSQLNEIIPYIAGQISKFKIQIAETGVFPSPRNARVLWIDVKDEKGSLREINRLLESECEKIGFSRENRSYKPHLTIARIRDVGKSKKLAETHLRKQFEPAGFEVGEIVIYESRLQPAGSIYQKLTTVQLKS